MAVTLDDLIVALQQARATAGHNMEAVVHDSETGHYYTINEVATATCDHVPVLRITTAIGD